MGYPGVEPLFENDEWNSDVHEKGVEWTYVDIDID